MDTVFGLTPESRSRLLERAAARVPGCVYLLLWAPVDLRPSSNILFCLDAWPIDDRDGGGSGDRVRALFDAYRRSLCAIVSGCVPGWAYKDGNAFMELPEPDLTASALSQVQQQLYHEAGIKMAVFMGCESGEIEIGMSTTAVEAAAAAANVRQVFSEDFVQQWLLEEFLHMPPGRPSSSSSSLPSISIGSPEYCSIARSASTSAAPVTEPSSQERQPPHGLLAQAYGRYGHVPLGSREADDATMARAMLTVISSSVRPPSSNAPPRWLARRSAQRSSSPGRAKAFKPYNAAISQRSSPRPRAPGQWMIKTSILILTRMHMAMRHQDLTVARQEEEVPQPPPPQPTSSQLHHMISERKRRERHNESFQALRALLPPGSKKDKATILAKTREYMSKLIAQVSDLQEKNRQLQAQLCQPDETQTVAGDSSERIQVQVITAGASTSTSDLPREVSIIRVTVRAACDLSELVVGVLRRLREAGRFVMVSVDARSLSNGIAQANLTLRVTAGDCDETSLKEAVTKIVEDIVPDGES